MKMDWKDICPECDYTDITTEDVTQADNDRNYECTLSYRYSCRDCGCRWTVTEKVIFSINVDEHGDTNRIPC